MAKQQSKRRKKRYDPGSAYAGDVRPTGILGILGGDKFIKGVFIVMAAALVVGGFSVVFFRNAFQNTGDASGKTDYVAPEDKSATGTPAPTQEEIKQYGAAPAMTIDTNKTYTATIHTDKGDIQVQLLPQQAPQAVNDFVFLARDGFYNGLVFHFADGQFSANAGDPSCRELGEACRGSGGPGYEITPEPSANFAEGTLGLSNGSQFFIALQPSNQFDGYTAFGTLTSGLDVAKQLEVGTKITSIDIQEQ